MEITFKETTWKNGRGQVLMEATADFPLKRVTVSEPIDSRPIEEIKQRLEQRLKVMEPEYA